MSKGFKTGGRPSKKDVALREEIIGLGLFVRDSDIYIEFEELTKDTKIEFVPYYYCEFCHYRNNDIYMPLIEINKVVRGGVNLPLGVENLPRVVLNYWTHISPLFRFPRKANTKEKCYTVSNEIGLESIKSALDLDIERYEHLKTIMNGQTLQFEDLFLYDVSDTEIEDIGYEHIRDDILSHSYKTIIRKDHTTEYVPFMTKTSKTKNAYLEIDFTKPLEEIISYVTLIKKDFDYNPETIQNIHDLMGVGEDIYQCDLKNCDIYTTNHVKPISGRLADTLFIYDCKKVNEILGADILTNDYILNEINKYWTETRNLFKDKMQPETLSEYHKLAVDYIDNEKYKCYLSGYDLDTKR